MRTYNQCVEREAQVMYNRYRSGAVDCRPDNAHFIAWFFDYQENSVVKDCNEAFVKLTLRKAQ